MADKNAPVILEIALNGITSKARNPTTPATSAEVERAKVLWERHGRQLATPAQTAAILGPPRGV
jgi:hypothetical protein